MFLVVRMSRSATSSVPAIALGHGLTVLATIRALGRRGVRSYCLGEHIDYIRYSRYYESLDRSRDPGPDSITEDVVARLPIDRAVLIPCTDHWARAVAGYSEETSRRFPCFQPSAEVLAQCADKRRFLDLLKTHDIPHPRSIPLESEEELQRIDLSRFEQGFLKPCDSQRFGAHFRAKAFTFNTPEEARTRFAEANRAGMKVILQEYIPGPPTEHYFIDGFVDRTGTVKAWFARRRLRMYPRPFGNSSYLVSVPLSDVRDGAESLLRLFAALQYRGIFSAEFKLDPRDRRLKILEINARPWWHAGFAADCGVNVLYMAYRQALGEDVDEAKVYLSGIYYAVTDYDGMACRELMQKGELSRSQWIRQWIAARHSIFVWYDPWPSLRGWIIRIVRWFAARFRK
jgi:D-aspartate ligase